MGIKPTERLDLLLQIVHDIFPSRLVPQSAEEEQIQSGGRGFDPHRGSKVFVITSRNSLTPGLTLSCVV